MSRALVDLLATDALARRFGIALNPRLRAAIEADLRFPAHAAGPGSQADATTVAEAENVIRLFPHMQGDTKSCQT